MVAFSLDLPERIIKSWQQRQSKSAIARTFMVSLSSVKRYVKRFENLGHVRPTVQGHMLGKLYARAPRGCRAYDRTTDNYGQNVTLLANIAVEGCKRL